MANKYDYLNTIRSPKLLMEALKLSGVEEIVGDKHNPIILKWAEDIGLKRQYTADEIPWCGLYVAYVVYMAGYNGVINPLWAKNWLNFGVKQSEAMLGDILIFTRPGGGGHVGFYVGEDDKCYHVLGGNQGNSVKIDRILKSRCMGIQRCDWKVGQPKTVKKYFVTPSGAVSTNEA
jgi:uncharacterized protein (TIGR02594 family)